MRATRQGANFMVVLIALVIIFQEQLTQLVNNIFSSIRDKAGTIY